MVSCYDTTSVMNPSTPKAYRTGVLLALVLLAIIVPFVLFGGAVDAWTGRLVAQAESHRRSTGLLLAMLLAVDIVLVSTACGMALGFAGGACASFAGMSLSAAAGYGIGRTASCFAGRFIGQGEVALLRTFHARYGVWMLLALRPVPVLAEASLVFSGLSRQPVSGVVAAAALGNAAVSLVYAAVGAWGRRADAFLPAFGVSLLLAGGLFWGLSRRRMRRDGATR